MLVGLTPSQKQRSEIILNEIQDNERFSIDHSGIINIDDVSTGVAASSFLYNIQQPRKRLVKIYEVILHNLAPLAEHLVSNTYAKEIVQKGAQWGEFEGEYPEEWLKFDK